jgi:hypothetical protein
MMSVTTDSIDLDSLRLKVLGPGVVSRPGRPVVSFALIAQSKAFQQGLPKIHQRVHVRALSQPQHGGNAGIATRPGDVAHLINDTVSTGLPSTVPESIEIDGFIAAPMPQAPSQTNTPKAIVAEIVADATQELSQREIDNLISMRKSRSAIATDRDETQFTLEENHDGFIDFSSFVPQPEHPDSEPIDFPPTQTQTQFKPTYYPESQRFKTPATASRRRDYNGNTKESPSLPRAPVLRSGGKTPGLAMGLSQAFNDTQAATSPFVSDIANLQSDQPSPGIQLQPRPATAPTSSPMRPLSDPRHSAEPASRYVPVGESQAARKLREQREQAGDFDTDLDSDADSTSGFVDDTYRQEQLRKARRDKEFKERALASSPALGRRTKSSPLPQAIGQTSPSTIHTSPAMPAFCSSPVPDANELGHADSEAETEQEDYNDSRGERSEVLPLDLEDKENLGSAIRIPETAARPSTMGREAGSTAESSPLLRTQRHNPVTTQIAVADSQSSQKDGVQPRQQPKSSSTSALDFVPGTQAGTQPQQTSSSNGLIVPESSKGLIADAPATEIIDKTHQAAHDQDVEINTATVVSEDLVNPTTDQAQTASSIRRPPHRSKEGPTPTASPEKQSGSQHALHINESNPEKHPLSEFETAPAMPLPRLDSPESSASVLSPRKKRRRMTQISAKTSPEQERWSQYFDPAEALGVDNDFLPPDESPIRPGKRRRVHYSVEVPETETVSSRANLISNSQSSDLNVDELSRPQPAVREPQLQTRLRTRPRDEHSSRASNWDLGATPSPQKQVPLENPRKPITLKAAQPNITSQPSTPAPAASSRLKTPELPLSTASAQKAPPNQTPTPKTTPERYVPQHMREHSEDTSSSLADANSEATYRTAPTGEKLAPNAIFACFNGKRKRAYYPAHCQGKSNKPDHYRVHWDGFGSDDVNIWGICSLDLRLGDHVKIELDGVPKVSHIIRGFKDKVGAAQLKTSVTDQRGHKTLVVAPKQRKSLPAEVSTDNEREVPVKAIYLDSNMWNQMKNRAYNFDPDIPTIDTSGHATPAEQSSTPTTPTSRHRRQTIAANEGTMLPTPHGIFSGMTFAISHENEDRKAQLQEAIQSHGGFIIQDSFYELFDQYSLRVKTSHLASGFAALLADKHSRKPKYLQALALGLPALSGTWVDQCLKQVKVVDWQHYLLPAGECKALEGAIKSRTILPYDATTARLSDIVDAAAPRMLDGIRAIVITGRGKAEQRMQPYLFLVRAMGAITVTKVIDARAAKQLMADDADEAPYDIIYVETKELESTTKALQPEPKKGRTGKAVESVTWRVLDTESIVQSLIFGSRLD